MVDCLREDTVQDSHLHSQLDSAFAVSSMDMLWLFVIVAWQSLANTEAQCDIGPGLSTLHSHLTQSLKGSRQHPMACIEDLLKTPRDTQIHRYPSPHVE